MSPIIKHIEGSVMAWGCMFYHGVGNWGFIDGIMYKKYYLTLLIENVKQSAAKLGIIISMNKLLFFKNY